MSDDIELETDSEAGDFGEYAEAFKKLKESLKNCKKERQEYLDGWQRAKADFVNSKKREEEERKEFIKFSQAELIKDILPVLDSFHTAFGNKSVWEKVDLNWRMGVQHIYSQFRGSLEKHGVKLIEPQVGEKFDPVRHQSTESIGVEEEEKDHTILEIVQKGYMLYDKVIEPAKVKIGEYERNNS